MHQKLSPGRFRLAESESGVASLEILHGDLEIKEKPLQSISSFIFLRIFQRGGGGIWVVIGRSLGEVFGRCRKDLDGENSMPNPENPLEFVFLIFLVFATFSGFRVFRVEYITFDEESESEIEILEFLHPDLEIKKNQSESLEDLFFRMFRYLEVDCLINHFREGDGGCGPWRSGPRNHPHLRA